MKEEDGVERGRAISLSVKVELRKQNQHKVEENAQYQIAVDGEMVHQFCRGGVAKFKLLERVLDKVLQAQVTERVKTAPFEGTPERKGCRNRYRSRELKTRVGMFELQILWVRDRRSRQSFFSGTNGLSKRCA